MYPTHLMSTVQSGKRGVKVKMKRAMSLVIKRLEKETKKSKQDNLRLQMCSSYWWLQMKQKFTRLSWKDTKVMFSNLSLLQMRPKKAIKISILLQKVTVWRDTFFWHKSVKEKCTVWNLTEFSYLWVLANDNLKMPIFPLKCMKTLFFFKYHNQWNHIWKWNS